MEHHISHICSMFEYCLHMVSSYRNACKEHKVFVFHQDELIYGYSQKKL